MKLFPSLLGKRRGSINLDACARHYWNVDLGVKAPEVSPFAIDPYVCLDLVKAQHMARNLDWSWGGYMEDRSILWAGSYLDELGRHLHLGVDFNVPAGTPVVMPRSGTVVLVDDDTPEKHGWGNRVVVKDEISGYYVIYAHLARHIPTSCGHIIEEGELIGQVGKPEENGGWYPHLHMQIVDPHAWTYFYPRLRSFLPEPDTCGIALRKSRLRELDGYGLVAEREKLMHIYPNPIVFLGL